MTDQYESSSIFYASQHSSHMSTSESRPEQLGPPNTSNSTNVECPTEASDRVSEEHLEIVPDDTSAVHRTSGITTHDTHMQDYSFLYSAGANALLNEDAHDTKAQEVLRILRGLDSLTGEVDHLLADSSASAPSATPITGPDRVDESISLLNEHSRDSHYGVLGDKKTFTERPIHCFDDARAGCDLMNDTGAESLDEDFFHSIERDEIAEAALAVAWGAMTCIVFLAGAL
ncbi:hypothetical protein BKA63DRAFT_494015 [Paraphoma chrysanthemicola]|nr:hypothetical protein BKA63DRAFT_494015 [Paraphoma chrysanthemicola]